MIHPPQGDVRHCVEGDAAIGQLDLHGLQGRYPAHQHAGGDPFGLHRMPEGRPGGKGKDPACILANQLQADLPAHAYAAFRRLQPQQHHVPGGAKDGIRKPVLQLRHLPFHQSLGYPAIYHARAVAFVPDQFHVFTLLS